MNPIKIVAIVLIVAGGLGLAYGGFTYTKETHKAVLGPIEMSVKDTQSVNVPIWASAAALAAGVVLLIVGSKGRLPAQALGNERRRANRVADWIRAAGVQGHAGGPPSWMRREETVGGGLAPIPTVHCPCALRAPRVLYQMVTRLSGARYILSPDLTSKAE